MAQNGHNGVVGALLEAKAEVNQTNRSGDTPLYISAKNWQEGVVKVLLKAMKVNGDW